MPRPCNFVKSCAVWSTIISSRMDPNGPTEAALLALINMGESPLNRRGGYQMAIFSLCSIEQLSALTIHRFQPYQPFPGEEKQDTAR